MRTKIQILISLERYLPALDIINVQPLNYALERAYCLYKTGRETEGKLVATALLESDESRAVQLILAQSVRFSVQRATP